MPASAEHAHAKRGTKPADILADAASADDTAVMPSSSSER